MPAWWPLSRTRTEGPDRTQRLRRHWDKHAGSYDRQMAFFDRVLFGDRRAWVCSQTTGDVLEVAIGSGRNLPLYPEGIRLTASTSASRCCSSPGAAPRSWAARSTCA
jgi:hypothetical protein